MGKKPEIEEQKARDLPPEQHDWQLIGKTYAQPRQHVLSEGISPASIEKSLFGVTTLLWQCIRHSETKKEEMLGSDESQLEAVCERAEKYGMQYIPYNGKKFAVALVPPDEGEIPVR